MLLAAIAALGIALVVLALALAGPALDAPRAAAAACEPARPHEAGDFDLTVESGGLTREYKLHVPASYTGSHATPLVFNIHGLGQGAEHLHGYSKLYELADAEGFLLVEPWGTTSSFIPTVHWNFTALEQALAPETPDDVLFFSDLLDQLEADLCIDATRVHTTGISNGAMMSVRLACDLSDRIASAAMVSGLYYPPWSPDLAAEPGCSATRPVPVVGFHGTADAIVPYAGGPLGLEFPFSVRNVETEVLPDWAAHNGCSNGPVREPVTENVDLVRFDGCAEGADVQLYAVEGGEHVWPGAEDAPAPDIDDEISASEVLWAFFEAHPMPVIASTGPAPTATPLAATATAVPALPSTGGGPSSGGGATPWLLAALGTLGAAAVGGAAVWRRRHSDCSEKF
jgi:polyhydroxybutyrate depolymerase